MLTDLAHYPQTTMSNKWVCLLLIRLGVADTQRLHYSGNLAL